jgi:hypothetical protein
MNTLSYNVNQAINYRSKTWEDLQYEFEVVPQTQERISFRESLDMSAKDLQWGNIPFHVEVLFFHSPCKKWDWHTMSRAEWKSTLKAYKDYAREFSRPINEYNANI